MELDRGEPLSPLVVILLSERREGSGVNPAVYCLRGWEPPGGIRQTQLTQWYVQLVNKRTLIYRSRNIMEWGGRRDWWANGGGDSHLEMSKIKCTYMKPGPGYP